ncbi:hypothetical protein UlMin_006952 [Ulmus minor]
MDIDREWEFIPSDGFLDFGEDGERKIHCGNRNSDSNSVFNMNYFVCPSPNSRKITENPTDPRIPNKIVPVPIPIQLNPTLGKNPEDELVKEITKLPTQISVAKSAPEAEQDTISQVFFKKNEFVDMKMDSPKSPTRGFLSQIDAGKINYDEEIEGIESLSSPRLRMIEKKKNNNNLESEDDCDGLNFWKLSFTGIGAICSFGIAAATICILFFGSHHRNKQIKQNQKLRFQIYTDDKRIKQVVQHANKLNEAITAARGMPLSRANITYGGYYDGL